MAKDKVKPVKISATVMWAFLKQRNQRSKKFQVDLCNLSDEDVAALSEVGIEARESAKQPEKGRFITCKSKMYEISAYDKDGNEIEDTIGNGSKARALIAPYTWTFEGDKGVSPSLKKLVITKLIRFEPDFDEDLDDEDL